MGKTGRQPQLFVVFGGECLGHPLAKGGGVGANIDGDIPHSPLHDPHQFALGVGGQLVVQPTQHALARAAVVVLHKLVAGAGGGIKGLLVKALGKKAPGIAKHFGFKHQYVGNRGLRHFHRTSPFKQRSRYWP